MDFQFQGSVLVDGEWVSRPADVYQIMARNQQQEDVDMDDATVEHVHVAPEIGILSKTIIESPLYKIIIPANIRHKDLDDIVFIGEDFVQLKEIREYGRLRHVATKSDFKGKIVAARAFGYPRKVQVNTSERNPLLKRASFHRSRRSTTGEEELSLPLEVIVLTLSTRTLMFLWATNDHAGRTTFAQRTVRLPTAASRFNRPGQHLAIDPRCRAIAVAAPEGCFMLFKTKTMDMWRREMRTGHDAVPIVEEAQCQVDGRVMHMEFLSAGTQGDDDHVVLMFILVHEGRTKIACYDWDFRNSLDIPARVTRSVLDFANRNPSLLIPLSRSTDFLLVHDEHISVCRGVLAGPPVASKTVLPESYLKPLRPGSNKGRPHWVQWDRAPRNPDFAKEAFYLAREDGAVIYVERHATANLLEISDAGSWPYPVDTAFACLKADGSEFAQSYPDVLVAGGFGGDGHLYKVGAWPKEDASKVPASETNAFGLVESLPNWAPLTDMVVARPQNMPLPYDSNRASLFVANGQTPHGEVSQLRRGLRALVHQSFPWLKGSTGLWIVDHGSITVAQDGDSGKEEFVTFLVSVPPETFVIRASRILREEGSYSHGSFGSAWDVGEWDTSEPIQDGLICNAETISACPLTHELTVQITYNEARLLRRSELKEISSIPFPNALLGAATKPGFPFIVVAFREGTSPILQVIPISDEGSFSTPSDGENRFSLTSDPTCIDILLSSNHGPLVFVGTANLGLVLFQMGTGGTLTPVWESKELDTEAGVLQHVYESAALLTAHGHEKLVCGTRDGFLICLNLTDRRILRTLSVATMGSTAVTIIPNKVDRSMAFVACGPDFCRIHLNKDSSMTIDSIWLDDPQCPTYWQGAANALDQVPVVSVSDRDSTDLGGFMFAVFGDRLIYTRMDYDITWSGHVTPPSVPERGKVIPRKLPTTSTPTKLMLVDHLPHHMIMVTTELKEERSPPNGYRTMLSSIKLLDVLNEQPSVDPEVKEEATPATPKNKLDKTEIPLKHYERVHSMMRWEFLDGKGSQRMLVVVGTGITESPTKDSGRRLVLNITKSGLSLQDKKRFDKPVRCVAAYDSQHIVSVIGNMLQLEQLERTDAARWKLRGQTELPSTGVDMTVSDNFIYVSTSHDSHLCFQVTKLDEPQDETTFKFSPVFSDSRQRSSLRHLIYKRPMLPHGSARSDAHTSATIVLLTDKSASVTGLLHPSTPSNKSAAPTLFEACLPRSVIRIHRGDIRPPWRRVYKHLDQSPCPMGVLSDDILGACTDGTIYSFAILDAPALHLLRLLQNLIEAKQKRDPALQFSTIKQNSAFIYDLLQHGAEGEQDTEIRARDVDPAVRLKGPAAPRGRHVDGDVLRRWCGEGGDLRGLVMEGCDGDVWRLFLEAGQKVLGASGECEAVVEAVREWVDEVLMPLL